MRAHIQIGIYTHIYIYPYDADGARRRCRAAHGSAGGRRAGGHGNVRVLTGYSNTGTQKGVLKKGVLKNDAQKEVLKMGHLKGGTQKGVLKRGY